jgi:hypothetical protein
MMVPRSHGVFHCLCHALRRDVSLVDTTDGFYVHMACYTATAIHDVMTSGLLDTTDVSGLRSNGVLRL